MATMEKESTVLRDRVAFKIMLHPQFRAGIFLLGISTYLGLTAILLIDFVSLVIARDT